MVKPTLLNITELNFLASNLKELERKSINKYRSLYQPVGEETFHAHRFIVSAHSRVMAAMFNTDMVEAKTGRVVISNDVDGATFQHFLNFLHTGQLENNAVLRNKQLYTLADQKAYIKVF